MTENEENLLKYDIERSTDGHSFEVLNSENALNISKATYTFIDENSLSGINYYRIKAIDKSGKYFYSETVTTNNFYKDIQIKVYPNPAKNNNIQVQLSNLIKGAYSIVILNSNGEIVFSRILQIDNVPEKLIRINKLLPTGSYFVKVSSDKNYNCSKTIIVE